MLASLLSFIEAFAEVKRCTRAYDGMEHPYVMDCIMYSH